MNSTLLYADADVITPKSMWWMRERIEDVGWTFRVMLNEFLRFNIVGVFNSAFALVLYETLYWIEIWPTHTAVVALSLIHI